jgi:hypothetical protein
VAATPAHLFGLEAVHLVARGNSWAGVFIRRRHPSVFCERMRRKRCGLGADGQRGSAGGCSKGEFQKVAAFHDISSFADG